MMRAIAAYTSLIDAENAASRSNPAHLFLAISVIAVAFWLRLQGLGAVGFYGDEETMALAVQGIRDNGIPLLPSGNLYPRALTQLYLMAASVAIFGESEWAMRLPSALGGVLSTVLAFFLGRRFLSPVYNVAFVAVIALTPALIEVSQTARMYIFYIAAVMAFALAIFRWEATGSWRSALGALAIMAVALEFHPLAIFAAPIAVFPLATHPGPKRLVQTLMVCGGSVLAFYLVRKWHAMNYDFGRLDERQPAQVSGLLPETLSLPWPAIAISIGIAAFAIYRVASRAGDCSGERGTKPLVIGDSLMNKRPANCGNC